MSKTTASFCSNQKDAFRMVHREPGAVKIQRLPAQPLEQELLSLLRSRTAIVTDFRFQRFCFAAVVRDL